MHTYRRGINTSEGYKVMKITTQILLGTTLLFSSALAAAAGGHGQETIGKQLH